MRLLTVLNVLFKSTPVRAKRRAPRPDGPLTHFASPRAEKYRLESFLAKIAIGADHAGFDLKQEIGKLLESGGHQVTDLGAHEYDALDDYPDFALAVARGRR